MARNQESPEAELLQLYYSLGETQAKMGITNKTSAAHSFLRGYRFISCLPFKKRKIKYALQKDITLRRHKVN